MYCEKCGNQIDDRSRDRFCPGCGAKLNRGGSGAAQPGDGQRKRWGSARPTNAQFPGQTSGAYYPEGGDPPRNYAAEPSGNGGDLNKILLAVVGVLALVLLFLLGGVLIKFLSQPKIGQGEPTFADAQPIKPDGFVDAFRAALPMTDPGAYPDCTSGYFSTVTEDLNGDGSCEYLAFYGDFAGTRDVELRVFRFSPDTGEATQTGKAEEAFVVKDENGGTVSLCAFLDDTGVWINSLRDSRNGWDHRYRHYSVENGALKLDYDFQDIVRGQRGNFIEHVSGTTYGSMEEMEAAAEGRGADVHSHGAGEQTLGENHLFYLFYDNDVGAGTLLSRSAGEEG